ncbi:hypothetical protein [Roseateles terrae]|uniref:Uncharacterized protein n=1 Tax=Roseateles terrae TaxID=431060 RepID=A0ABR6GQH9_9BURK|nr:hypothetical protein [Roseateles terrae]MBB3194362.1 hypothetical protein [Roseateles terrae]
MLPAGFTAPPGDLFDALALALHQRAASLPGAPPSPGGLTGMRLRQEVADWLQTPAGRRCEGPRPTTPVLEPVDEALIAELATFIRQDLPAALAIRPRTLSPVRHPGPADTPLDQVIHTLRSGGWCDALDHLVPTLLTRLPRSYRCATHALVVDYTGPCGQYGWAHPSGNRIYLSRQPDGTVSFDGWKRRSMTYPAEPDSFLEAALDIPCGALNRRMPGVREELAAIMACNRTLMDLRLALADRRYPCDQEMLLRMCLIHGELTLAGDQLMHPERPQRAVTADDLWRWFEQGSSALDRTETAIAAAGISVVDAYRLASPLRPTRAGNVLMGAPVAFLRRESYGGVQLLEQKLPELTYACQSFCRLEEHLCTSHRHLASLFPAALRERAKRFCAEAAAAEQVNLPPGLQGTTLQKP